MASKPPARKPAKPPVLKPNMLMKEQRGSPRGLVPTAAFGRHDEVYNAYLEEIDPRSEGEDQVKALAVQQALAASKDIRFTTFLQRACEPAHRRKHLATIAKLCNITMPEFADFMQSAQKMIALARAQAGVVDITSDMVQDAKSKEVVCGRCDGYGVLLDEVKSEEERRRAAGAAGEEADDRRPTPVRPCPECKGSGKGMKPGDTDSRKLLLEMTGMVGKRAPTVQINNTNYGGAGMESAVGKLSRVSFDLEMGEGETIDVTTGQ